MGGCAGGSGIGGSGGSGGGAGGTLNAANPIQRGALKLGAVGILQPRSEHLVHCNCQFTALHPGIRPTQSAMHAPESGHSASPSASQSSSLQICSYADHPSSRASLSIFSMSRTVLRQHTSDSSVHAHVSRFPQVLDIIQRTPEASTHPQLSRVLELWYEWHHLGYERHT